MTRKDAEKLRRKIEKVRQGKLDLRATRRAGRWERVLYAGITLVNLGMRVYLLAQKRREIVQAVQEDKEVLVLVRENARPVTLGLKQPKPPKKPEKQG